MFFFSVVVVVFFVNEKQIVITWTICPNFAFSVSNYHTYYFLEVAAFQAEFIYKN